MLKDDVIFQITEEDVQYEAIERMGRELTVDEMYIAKKGIEYGLGDINLIFTYDAIFEEIINVDKS